MAGPKYMWITPEDGYGRRWLAKCCDAGVPGLVFVQRRPGLWSVTHIHSNLRIGPLFGIGKAREFVRLIADKMDWTRPANELSTHHGAETWSDAQEEMQRICWGAKWRSPARRGLPRRLRVRFGYGRGRKWRAVQ